MSRFVARHQAAASPREWRRYQGASGKYTLDEAGRKKTRSKRRRKTQNTREEGRNKKDDKTHDTREAGRKEDTKNTPQHVREERRPIVFMDMIFRHIPLYRFLWYCQNNPLSNTVLDCGAGGDCPPLALFRQHGYLVRGIDLDKTQVHEANHFATQYGLHLNISLGDMRRLPFADHSFSYVYSYNSIFHMRKRDIAMAVTEIKRVLHPGGLCFVNFLTIHDVRYGAGEQVGEGEYLQKEGTETVIHSFFHEDEAERYFEDMTRVFTENRVITRRYQ